MLILLCCLWYFSSMLKMVTLSLFLSSSCVASIFSCSHIMAQLFDQARQLLVARRWVLLHCTVWLFISPRLRTVEVVGLRAWFFLRACCPLSSHAMSSKRSDGLIVRLGLPLAFVTSTNWVFSVSEDITLSPHRGRQTRSASGWLVRNNSFERKEV